MFKKKTASFIIFVIIDNTNLAYVYFYHCLNVNKKYYNPIIYQIMISKMKSRK